MFAPRWIVTPAATLIVVGAALLGGASPASAGDRDFRGHDNGRYDRDRDRDHGHNRDSRGGVQFQIAVRDPGPAYCPPTGHYIERQVQVLVAPGHYEERRTAPVLENRTDYYGHRYTVEVVPAGCVRVWVPAVYETRCERVWVADAPRYVERPGGFFFGIRF